VQSPIAAGSRTFGGDRPGCARGGAGYGLWSAGEQVRAEAADAKRRQGGESHRGAQARRDDVFLKPDLYHGGRDTELGGRD
jgi:hypothetical protein